jgi:hypothetical protein
MNSRRASTQAPGGFVQTAMPVMLPVAIRADMSRYPSRRGLMRQFALATALLCAGLPLPSRAGPITGVTVTTSTTSCCNTDVARITDGSGLSSYTPGASHAAGQQNNAWATYDALPGSLTFDLGGRYTLDGLAIWNFNSNNQYSIKTLQVLGSTDGTNFFAIPGAPTQLDQAPFLAATFAQQFAITATASFIRFNIEASYNPDSPPVGFGLAEVMFLSQAIPERVPEPASLALLAAAGLALAAARSRRA